MITDRARPNASSIAIHAIPSKLRIQGGQIRHNMTHNLPVDQIPRMQDYHSGGVLHSGGDRVEIIAHANRIQVAEVAWKNGIYERPILLIAPSAH
jgi:hypothetical protein